MYFTICVNEGQTHICKRDFNLAYYLEVENMVLPVFNLFITRGSNVQTNMNVSWSTFTICFSFMHLQYFGLNAFLSLCISVCLYVFQTSTRASVLRQLWMDAVLRKSEDASVKSSAVVTVAAAGVKGQLFKCVLYQDQVINTHPHIGSYHNDFAIYFYLLLYYLLFFSVLLSCTS